MKITIIYDSAYGNTETIAHTIEKICSAKNDTSLTRVGGEAPNLEGTDLLFVGSPTQGGQATKALQAYLDQLRSIRGLKFAAFDTRMAIEHQGLGLKMLMKVISFAAPKIAKTLISKDGSEVIPAEGFIVTGREGPLADGELERAAAWTRSALEKMS